MHADSHANASSRELVGGQDGEFPCVALAPTASRLTCSSLLSLVHRTGAMLVRSKGARKLPGVQQGIRPPAQQARSHAGGVRSSRSAPWCVSSSSSTKHHNLHRKTRRRRKHRGALFTTSEQHVSAKTLHRWPDTVGKSQQQGLCVPSHFYAAGRVGLGPVLVVESFDHKDDKEEPEGRLADAQRQATEIMQSFYGIRQARSQARRGRSGNRGRGGQANDVYGGMQIIDDDEQGDFSAGVSDDAAFNFPPLSPNPPSSILFLFLLLLLLLLLPLLLFCSVLSSKRVQGVLPAQVVTKKSRRMQAGSAAATAAISSLRL